MNIILFHSTECGQLLALDDYRAHHLLHVLHAREGGRYKAGIIDGAVGQIVIERITSKAIKFDFIASSSATSSPLIPLTLIIGHPRPLVTKRLIADLSSIGISNIHFFIADNSEKSYFQSSIWRNDTVRKMCIKGAEQSGTTIIPSVYRHNSLIDALRAVEDALVPPKNDTLSANRWVRRAQGARQHRGAYSSAARQYLTLPDTLLPSSALSRRNTPVFMAAEHTRTHAISNIYAALRRRRSMHRNSRKGASGTTQPAPTVVAIGGERGWTEEDACLLQHYHYQPRTLGARILRTDSAAVAASILVAQHYLVAADLDRA